MPIRNSDPRNGASNGTPSWVELRTADYGTAVAFYGELFDWRFDPAGSATDGHCLAHLRDVPVAGISAADNTHGDSPDACPSGWVVYLAVEDLDQVVKAVPEAGGRVTVAAHDRPEGGRAAIVTDPTGAMVGLLQAYQESCSILIGEPGSVLWFELLTDDRGAAAGFYQRILGLTSRTADLDGNAWTTLHAGPDAVAGVVTKRTPGPARWNVYFGADDLGAVTERAVDLGATITAGPATTAIGPMAGVRDSTGVNFSLWSPLQNSG